VVAPRTPIPFRVFGIFEVLDHMIPIQERNRQIIQLRKDGMSQREVARKFDLSPTRIYLIVQMDDANKAMAVRRAKLQEAIRADNDPEKVMPVCDVVDAIGLSAPIRNRLLHHFTQTGKISLRELMEMCLNSPKENGEIIGTPLLRVYGIGKKGFWCIVRALSSTDMGSQCNEEWQRKLVKVKRDWGSYYTELD